MNIKRKIAASGITVLLATSGVGATAVAASATPAPSVVVCKYVGTPGVDETAGPTITVNGNALGHNWDGATFPWDFGDAQDNSIAIGFEGTEATCPAPQGPPVVEDVDYHIAAWLMAAAPPNHFDSPQGPVIADQLLEDKDLNALDDELEAYRLGLTCETAVDIQVDGYLDDEVTDSLIAGNVLYGPNNPTEHLWGGGEGVAWKFVHLVGPDCEDPPKIVQFSAPAFNAPERCDLAGSIEPGVFEGIIWSVIFDALTGAYTVDASAATGYTIPAEVQTHWAGNLGALEPCPQVEVCETFVTNPAVTALLLQGWEIVGGQWTKDGLVLTASSWSDSYAFHEADFNLSEAAGLGLDLEIDGAGVWAVILETAAGNIHYEPEPYTLDLWTNASGILPASLGGQGGDYAGNLDDIIGDPHVTGVYLYFSTGSEEPVSALLSSGSYNCVTQPFAAAVAEEPPVTPETPEKLVTTGTDSALPFIGAGGAILFGIMLAVGGAILRRRAHI